MRQITHRRLVNLHALQPKVQEVGRLFGGRGRVVLRGAVQKVVFGHLFAAHAMVMFAVFAIVLFVLIVALPRISGLRVVGGRLPVFCDGDTRGRGDLLVQLSFCFLGCG
jgi:hypothetical protein